MNELVRNMALRRTGLLILALMLLGGNARAPARDRLRPTPDPLDQQDLRLPAAVAISSDQQMDFGQLADKDGAVVLGLSDNISSDPDLIHYGGSPYSAICTITGDPSTAVDVSVSTNPANGLSLSDFTSSEGDLPLVGVLLDESGELVLTLGATLTVDRALASVGSGQSVPYTITSSYN